MVKTDRFECFPQILFNEVGAIPTNAMLEHRKGQRGWE
jgi:hypothetical protein